MSDGRQIEQLIGAQKWACARRALRAKLRVSPDDHWLLTRLSLTYYEEHRYNEALEYSFRAVTEAPDCPLALLDYAGSLQMLDQTQAALDVYSRLIRRGVDEIAFGDCGEGLAWARGLVADCHYRVAPGFVTMRRRQMAIKSLRRHISLRGPGCRSIYQLSFPSWINSFTVPATSSMGTSGSTRC